MKVLAAIALVGATLMVSGCVEEQQQQLAACRLDATQRFPWATYNEPDSNYANRFNYVKDCMEAHGYSYNVLNERCNGSDHVEKQVYCWQPTDKALRYVYWWETNQNPNHVD